MPNAKKIRSKIEQIEQDNKPVIKIKLAYEARMPEYAYEGDAGLDLFSNEEAVLIPRHRKDIGTGIYLEIPEGYAGLVWDKSGLTLKSGIKTMAGVVDSSYRGELKVVLINLSSKAFKIKRGMKISQLLIQKVEHVELKTVDELEESERGKKGFGSTGSGLNLKRERVKSDLKSIKKEIFK